MRKVIHIAFALLLSIFSQQTGGAAETSRTFVRLVVNGSEHAAFTLPAQEEPAGEAVADLLSRPELHLHSVSVRSGASPDGRSTDNRDRSDRRAEDAVALINHWAPASARLDIQSVGEDYEKLRTLLEDSDIPGAEEALRIIDEFPVWVISDGAVVNSRKKELMDLRGGQTWHRMREELFPLLQETDITFLFQDEDSSGDAASSDEEISSDPPIRICFPFDSAHILPGYRTNARSLARLDSLLGSSAPMPGDTLVIVGQASMDGPASYNKALSARRAEAIRSYIAGHYPHYAGVLSIRAEGEPWSDLRDNVAASGSLSAPTRDTLLGIIDSDAPADRKEAQLKSIPGWNGIARRVYPEFRASTITRTRRWTLPRVEDEPALTALDLPAGPSVRLRPDRLEVPALTPQRTLRPVLGQEESYARKTIFAIKTNLAYDALTMLNYAIEVPLGDRFSIVWEHYFPWWVMRNNRICVEYLTLGGEARWWFAPQPRPATARRVERDRLVGHYLGAYGFWGKADLQWDRIGCYQCYPVWSAGLTYGFVFPVSKHLNLELSASFGYARIPYQHYIPSDDWQILWRDHDDAGTTHYFGPTKLQVTLAWPIRVKYRVREGAKR